MKKYLVSCTTYIADDEMDSMFTFECKNVDEMFDKLMEQVRSEWKTMWKLTFVYSEAVS